MSQTPADSPKHDLERPIGPLKYADADFEGATDDATDEWLPFDLEGADPLDAFELDDVETYPEYKDFWIDSEEEDWS